MVGGIGGAAWGTGDPPDVTEAAESLIPRFSSKILSIALSSSWRPKIVLGWLAGAGAGADQGGAALVGGAGSGWAGGAPY